MSKDLGIEGRTLPEMLKNRTSLSPEKIAYRSKKNGVWTDTSWRQVEQRVEALSYGLISLGMKFGDRVAILSNSREEWILCNYTVLTAGGTVVPLYASNPAELCLYILNDASVSFLFVEDEKQFKKILSVKDQLPFLKNIILIVPPKEPLIDSAAYLTFEQLAEQGIMYQKTNPQALHEIATTQNEKSIALIAYTSGTTGQPKGVILLHEAFIAGTRYALGATPATPEDLHLMFLPMAHIFGYMLNVYLVRVGFCTAFAESLEKLAENIQEIKPTCMVCVPRVFEKVYNGFLQKIQESSPLKRFLAHWALGIGKQASKMIQAKKQLSLFLRIKYAIADRLVFQKLRDRLGGKLKWFISGSAPLSKEIIEFFHAARLMILEGYGLTETAAITTVNQIDDYQFGTVGKVQHPDLQIKLAADSEILTKGITNFQGYYNLPEATKESIDEDGWFHTGDIGSIDPNGFLSITDRKKDLIKTSGGKFVAPQMLEGKLKLHPLVSQAVIIGDQHQYITALFTVNLEAARKFFALQEMEGNETLSDEQVRSHPTIHQQLAEHLTQVNRTLGSWEQIKYFKILPKELTEADGELTPSMKVKRKVVEKKYKDLILSMYDEHLNPHEHIFG